MLLIRPFLLLCLSAYVPAWKVVETRRLERKGCMSDQGSRLLSLEASASNDMACCSGRRASQAN